MTTHDSPHYVDGFCVCRCPDCGLLGECVHVPVIPYIDGKRIIAEDQNG